ncbi:MAG: LOG family protein [Blastocatellia bacterium]|nr:LOG family protein [Blastocatellia bacterium]
MHRPVISIFGSSRCQPEEWEYREAERLGRQLAEAGYTVCTGGYAGVMEAANRGAWLAGGDSWGVTVDVFSEPPNAYLSREIRTRDLLERLKVVSELAHGFVALRGGIGTLAEIALFWNLALIEQSASGRPLILLGECWDPILASFLEHLAFRPQDLSAVVCVSSAEEAVREICRRVPRGISTGAL